MTSLNARRFGNIRPSRQTTGPVYDDLDRCVRVSACSGSFSSKSSDSSPPMELRLSQTDAFLRSSVALGAPRPSSFSSTIEISGVSAATERRRTC